MLRSAGQGNVIPNASEESSAMRMLHGSMTEKGECAPLSGTKRSILEGKIGGAKVVAGVM